MLSFPVEFDIGSGVELEIGFGYPFDDMTTMQGFRGGLYPPTDRGRVVTIGSHGGRGM